MNKYFKKIVSFVVALTILVGSFLGGTINSYAGSVDFDDEKFIPNKKEHCIIFRCLFLFRTGRKPAPARERRNTIFCTASCA